jgi:hypothetical protein
MFNFTLKNVYKNFKEGKDMLSSYFWTLLTISNSGQIDNPSNKSKWSIC